jgi:hypothetical protein
VFTSRFTVLGMAFGVNAGGYSGELVNSRFSPT